MLGSIEEVGIEKGIEIGIEQGVKIGVEQGVEGTAKNLLKSGLLTNRRIADVTGLKLKRVNELAKALKTQAEQ